VSPAPGAEGVQEIGEGVFAYLQRGGWGMSNAGLIAGSGSALLIDTLYDVHLTERMLGALRRATPAAERIDTVVNTHANGDHCWGNQAVRGARIIASRAAAEEMQALSPGLMSALVSASRIIARTPKTMRSLLGLLGRLGVPRVTALEEAADFVVEHFGAFDFRGVTLTPPTESFEGRLELTVGGTGVELIEVGPAHTRGDAIVHLPHARVAFSGDILFIGSHPIIWEGPVENWIRACDRLLELDVDVIVPGHGPITDKQGVARTREYWVMLSDTVKAGHAAGASGEDIARELFDRGFDGWTESSRVAVNVDTLLRSSNAGAAQRDPLEMLAAMARLERLEREKKG
jgi:cyclase